MPVGVFTWTLNERILMKKLLLLVALMLAATLVLAAPALAHPGHYGAYQYGCGPWQIWWAWFPGSGWWGHYFQWCHNPWGWYLNWGWWVR